MGAQRIFTRKQEQMGHVEKTDRGDPRKRWKMTGEGEQVRKYIDAQGEEHRKKIEAKKAKRRIDKSR